MHCRIYSETVILEKGEIGRFTVSAKNHSAHCAKKFASVAPETRCLRLTRACNGIFSKTRCSVTLRPATASAISVSHWGIGKRAKRALLEIVTELGSENSLFGDP